MSRVADILVALGANAARARELSGQQVGSAVSTLGNVPLAIQQNTALQREQALHDQAQSQQLQIGQAHIDALREAKLDEGLTQQLVRAHSTQDPESGHVVTDHDAVTQELMARGRMNAASNYSSIADTIQEHNNKIQADHLAMLGKVMQRNADIIGSIADAPPEQQPSLYASVRGQLSAVTPNDPALKLLPPEYPGPEAMTSLHRSQMTDTQRAAASAAALEKLFKESEIKKNEAQAAEAAANANNPKGEPQLGGMVLGPDNKEMPGTLTFVRNAYQLNGAALPPGARVVKAPPPRDPLAEELARARLEDRDSTSVKNQQKFEQEYRTVLQRGLSSRSGGLGLEDAKVQQANHLISLLDQTYDAKTGEWNIPRVQLNELALGLARLTAPGGQAGEQMLREFQQRTVKGDMAGALTYLTGEPVAANTQAITKFLKDSIVRQGETAQQNREGEMAYLRGLAPTDLEEDRRVKLETTSLNPLRQSRVATNAKGERKLFVSVDGGKTWQ